jgi:hypothetical protein
MIGIVVIAVENIAIIYGHFTVLCAIIIYAYTVAVISDFDFEIIYIYKILDYYNYDFINMYNIKTDLIKIN